MPTSTEAGGTERDVEPPLPPLGGDSEGGEDLEPTDDTTVRPQEGAVPLPTPSP